MSSSYPSEQSGAPSHRYWIEIQFPSPGHLNGSYGWHASESRKDIVIIGTESFPFIPDKEYIEKLCLNNGWIHAN